MIIYSNIKLNFKSLQEQLLIIQIHSFNFLTVNISIICQDEGNEMFYKHKKREILVGRKLEFSGRI